MIASSSPYAVFRVSDWNSVLPEPNRLSQFPSIAPKKFSPRVVRAKDSNGNFSKKRLLKSHVHLAFA